MRARFILLVFVALLMLRVNGSGQSAQLPPASEMKTVGLIEALPGIPRLTTTGTSTRP